MEGVDYTEWDWKLVALRLAKHVFPVVRLTHTWRFRNKF